MFTDMVGYTALMSENERKAKEQRARHRAIIEQSVAENHGEIIQYFGDGTLVVFDSAIESVQSALDIQRQMVQEPKIPLRIGIHIGDIVRTEDGIYGEGVNIASRIESFSQPGAIMLSEKVATELTNHPRFDNVFLGMYNLKNVKRPMGIYAVSAPFLHMPKADELQGKGSKSAKGIAVLPFLNLSSDPENEFFSDGITEEILNALVRIDGLKVTSRTTSFALKNDKRPIKEIAAQLGVESILEGSVRKAGNRVRITAQLINAISDEHFWSETYDRQLEDIFAVQDEIAGRIADKLEVELGFSDNKDGHLTKNMEAYEAYLKGRFYVNKFTPPDAITAIKLFEKSSALDPNYVMPITGIASMYAFLGAIGGIHPQMAFPKAEEYAKRALDMDLHNSNSNASMALVELFYHWNWEKVDYHLRECEREAQPDLLYYVASFMYMTSQRQFNELVPIMTEGRELDPLNPFINFLYAQTLMYKGDIESAEPVLHEILQMNPNYRAALEAMGWVYLERGEIDNCLNVLRRYHELIGDPNKGLTFLAYVNGLQGNYDIVDEYIQRLDVRQQENPTEDITVDYAQMYLAKGDIERSLDYLEKAVGNRLGFSVFLGVFPMWRKLHGNPRFEALLKKIGIQSSAS